MSDVKEALPEEAKRIAIKALEQAMDEMIKDSPDLAHVYCDIESALIWLRAKRPVEQAHPDTMIGRRS